MTWYTGICGSWRKPESIQRLDGTYNRKEIFAKAQELANERNEVVTVHAETGSPHGLKHKFYDVSPQYSNQAE